MNLQRSRDKWQEWSTKEIENFLLKYNNTSSLGKRSSRKIKKIRFLKQVLAERQRVERLLNL